MKTMVGLPKVGPSAFEYALMRVEIFKRENFDKETLLEFVRYVAETSHLDFKSLAEKMRIDLAD